MKTSLVLPFAAAVLSGASTIPAPPAAPVRPVTDTYFGQSVTDPYRWLENTKDPEVIAWMKAQNDHARAILQSIPGRKDLFSRISALDNAGTVVSGVQRWGGRYFYFKTEPGSDNRKLFARDSLSSPERLLVDTEKMTRDEKHFSIDYFNPSLDGRYVAYGISQGGSENSVLHVIESESAAVLPDAIDRAQFGAVSWLPDGKTFYYNRLQKLAPDAAPTAVYQKNRVYRHTLGADPESDAAVFGFGVSPDVSISEDDFSYVIYSPASHYLFGGVNHGVQNEITLYSAPWAAGEGGAPVWRKVVDTADAVTSFDVHGESLFLLTHQGASRFKVVRLNLQHPDFAGAEVVVPPGDVVLTAVGVAQDGVYVQDLDGGPGHVRKIPFGRGSVQPITLPFEGAVSGLFTNPQAPGALLEMTSWTKPPAWLSIDATTGKVADTGLVAPSPVDFSKVVSEEVKAKSSDGTLVPLSIIHKKGISLNGAHPTLLDGYGAYGITLDPYFRPTSLAWIERGGVLAEAHVRGGGEYGEDWHLAGKLLTKQHTIDDFIACAQYLIEHKYTSPSRLSGEGTSAGGITIGGAITQRPDLFGAALIRVGDSDALRSETMESGPANIPEFGTVKDPDGFKALLAMDAYQHVRDGARYPAVLLTTGTNDPRVAPWQAAKMAARLQAATSSARPVILRVDYDAGHGLGSTKSQRDEETADEMAFLLWQLSSAPAATDRKK